ncbi:MAG TPA: erythromycin esterase family protein [Vicinamibacterales bacterium]|nr:erythromycin esterase family protein [Vicinamibacterales bacterium]
MTSTTARLLLLAALVGCTSPTAAQTSSADRARDRNELRHLTLLSVETGRLAPGETTCLGLALERGEFTRISIDADAGFLRARILEPQQHDPLQTTLIWSFSPSLPLAIEAPESGLYLVELSVPTPVPFDDVLNYQVQMSDRVSAAARAAHLEDLRRDPRVASLRESAVPVRSIDPNDTDFADLEFLREALRDVRIVLLGEGDHGGGSDVLAKTRLTKFLHQEMGFDVVAFEAGLYSSAVAWRALQTEQDPREAALKGLLGILARSAQAESLIRYLYSSARSSRPLELAGFDSQLTGTAAPDLLRDLRRFLRERDIPSPLLDDHISPTRVLAGIIDRRFAREPETLPGATEQAEAVETLRATAEEVASRSADRDGSFWAQVLRSTAVQIDLSLESLRGASHAQYGSGRDRQMSENLLWLTNTRYRGDKIVVWTHTSHSMRSPRETSHGRVQGFTMGHGLWQALGEESFAISFTSYDGTTHWLTQPDGLDQEVIPDQHPSWEFEELMNAVGHELAFVNLRAARARGDWLGGSFLASALYLMPEHARWSDALDALFFIRTQEPRREAR